MALKSSFHLGIAPRETQAKFQLEFATPKIRDEWSNALFADTVRRRHGPLLGRVLAEIGEIAALAPPGRSFHTFDLGRMEWLVTRISTESREPERRFVEDVMIYGKDANQQILARVRTIQERLIANLRREGDLASRTASVLRSHLGFLYTILDMLSPALFLCKANGDIQERLVVGVEENAELFSTGKLSFEHADRNVRRLLALVQKHLPMSA